MLVLAVLLVWGHSVSFQFVWDDKFFIEDSTSIRSLTHTPEMFYSLAAQSSYPEGFVLFRPLRTLHYAVLHALDGGTPRPWLFHLANLVWHAATAILLYRLLLWLFAKQTEGRESKALAPWLALLGALAFAVHPVVSEVVCWAKGLDDIMATAFVLASCGALLRWKPETGARDYCWAVGFFALAVYSKESAVPFALFCVPLLARLKEQQLKQALRWSAPFFAVAFVFVVHRHLVIGRTSQTEPLSGTYGQTLIDTLTAGPIYGRLLAGIPPFCIDYSYMQSGHALTSAPVIAGAVLLLALVALSTLTMRRTTALLGLGCLWVFLFLLPVSNVIPSMQFCAERFLYLPLIGWVVALGSLLLLVKNPRVVFTVCTIALLGWSAVAWNRSWIWKDALTLFVQSHLDGPTTQRVQDNAVDAAFNLPHLRAVFERAPAPGQPAMIVSRPLETTRHADWTAIERTLSELHQLFTNDTGVTTALAISKLQLGRTDEALPCFEQVARQRPNDLGAWNNFGRASATAGRTQQAEEAFRHALALQPDSVPTLQQLAELQERKKDFAAARVTYERLRKLEPGQAGYAQALAAVEHKLAAPPVDLP